MLQIQDNVEQALEACASVIVEAAEQSVAQHGRFLWALAGGGTPRGLYQLLASPRFRHRIDWPRVEFFWGDERAVGPEHADSNFRMARQSLLQPLGIAAARTHRIRSEDADLARAAADYQRTIAEVCQADPAGPPPALDLILLGMGGDGHTASLFPHTAALAEKTRWVVANHVAQLATDRITMTAPLINQARRVVFLVCGDDKAPRLAEVLEGPLDPERLPSQLIRPSTGRLTWIVDRPSAAKLRSGSRT